MPGFFHILKYLIQNHLDDAGLGWGEFPAFDLGMAPFPAEKIVHQLEHQLGVQHEQGGAPQRAHLAQVKAGGHIQRVNVLTKFHDLDAAGGNVGVAAHEVEQTDSGIAGKPLIDHFQGRHATTDDAVLTGEIVGLYAGIVGFFVGVNVTVIHPMEEGIDFIL